MAKKSCIKQGAHEEDGRDVFLPSRLSANDAQKQREQQQRHFQPMIIRERKLELKVISVKLYLIVLERIQQRKQAAVS